MFIFKNGSALGRVVKLGGSPVTRGFPVIMMKGRNLLGHWPSQRQAAKALGVSANVLSKHLSGKLPKLHF